MKSGFLNSLICVLLIGLIVPGMIPDIASAVEDIDNGPDDNGNSTVDLVIESLSFEPENPEPGQKVDIITLVKNQGNGTSESTDLVYYSNGNLIGDSRVRKIEAGQNEQISFSWEHETEEGTVEITAIVDERDSVPETDENNNEKTQSLTFKGTELPDLTIETLKYPEEPKTGEPQIIEISVKNQGKSVSEKTALKLYIGEDEIENWDIPSLAAGEESEPFLEEWTPVSEGSVEIKAVVDEGNLVNESNEENNQKADTVTVAALEKPLPDLIIETFKYPENSEPGKNENIEIRVKNQGTSVSEGTKLKLYIGGVQVKEWDTPSLAAGENSEPFSHEWTPVSEGSVEIKAVVDEGDLVNESNEENNQKADTLTVAALEKPLPDLVIEDIFSEEGDPQVGKLSNFTVKIKNQGAAPAAEVVAAYYINGKAVNESIRVPALSEGANTSVSFSLTPEKGGEMEVKVFVDSGTSISESNESNNQLIKVIAVKGLLPDLKIESLSLDPENPKPGENITFTVTIKNDGSGDASSNELKYSINGTNETYSGKISISALSAGNTTKGTFYWAPGNEGQIEVKAIVDAGSVVSESDETNNELTKTATVTKETTSSNSGGGGRSRSSSSSAGGGTTSKEPSSNVDAKELATRHVINSYRVKFDFIENVTCITYIEFDPKKTFKRTTTIVEVLKNKSVFVPELPSGRIYKNVNIWVGDEGAGRPGSFKNGLIEFKVEKEWIKENNVDQSLITLQWYDKSWLPLNTERVREDMNYIYFKAETPGFSCFAITESVADEKSKPEVKEGGRLQETLKNWGDRDAGDLNGSAEDSSLIKNPMGKAKILMAISLPLFMILVEYFILKKKI